MTTEPRSFYLPSPDELYKDLCRDMKSDLYDIYWHETKAEAVASMSTQSGTLHSWCGMLAPDSSPPRLDGPRVIRLEYVKGGNFDFRGWYESAVQSCCGEKIYDAGTSCHVLFETVEDAFLVFEYLTNVADSDEIRVSLINSLPSEASLPSSQLSSPLGGKIIHVVMSYSTCMDRVIEDFSRFGKIMRIIIFTKDTRVQALIEYASPKEAEHAIRGGVNDGVISIQYSNLRQLEIQQNNNRAWDFTVNPVRSSRALSSASPLALISIGFNEVLSMKKLPKELKEWAKQLPDDASGLPDAMGNKGCDTLCWQPSPPTNVSTMPTPTLLVTNLKWSSIDEVFNIWSIYGVCCRIKILKNNAVLVQFNDPLYSSYAKYFLSNRVYDITSAETSSSGRGCQISYSNIELKSCSKLYNQSDQRFSEIVKYTNSVCFPSQTIFLANISKATKKANLVKFVSSVGTPLAYDIRQPYPGGPKKPHMLVQYKDVQTAIRAIAKLHNTVIDGSQIKIACSKVKLTK